MPQKLYLAYGEKTFLYFAVDRLCNRSNNWHRRWNAYHLFHWWCASTRTTFATTIHRPNSLWHHRSKVSLRIIVVKIDLSYSFITCTSWINSELCSEPIKKGSITQNNYFRKFYDVSSKLYYFNLKYFFLFVYILIKERCLYLCLSVCRSAIARKIYCMWRSENLGEDSRSQVLSHLNLRFLFLCWC